jgi:hypothetical protein
MISNFSHPNETVTLVSSLLDIRSDDNRIGTSGLLDAWENPHVRYYRALHLALWTGPKIPHLATGLTRYQL